MLHKVPVTKLALNVFPRTQHNAQYVLDIKPATLQSLARCSNQLSNAATPYPLLSSF